MSLPDDCSGPDLAIGTVRGLRTFDLTKSGWLMSISRTYRWRDGENVATCHMIQYRERFLKHRASAFFHGEYVADPECSCGFYAYYDGSIFRLGNILGIIDAYGHVTVGTKGFRAEKAKVVALCIDTSRKILLRDFVFPFIFLINILVLSSGAMKDNSFSLGDFIYTSVLSVLFGVSLYFEVHGIMRRRVKASKLGPAYELLRVNYPDAEIFTSQRKMIKKYTPNSGGLTDTTFRRSRWSIYRFTMV